MSCTARQVAQALCKVNPLAGHAYDEMEPQSARQRVENLLRDGRFGPYVASGDPNEWGGQGVVATIYMEPHGGANDCIIPLDYYGKGMDHSFEASDLLGDYYIEFVNAAVACVYPA